MNKISLLIAFIGAFMISSCGPSVVYTHQENITEGWQYSEVIDFTFDIDDIEKKYDLVLVVGHSADYAYQNFYTNVTTLFPDGTSVIDPLSIELANKMGSWLSKCDNESCTLPIILRDDIRFKQTGTYKISFQQNSRDQILKGINSISLSLILAE